jgi:predicted thioredoxin/glutaredoxin
LLQYEDFGIKIKGIGFGCQTCHALYKMFLDLKEQVEIKVDIEYSKNIFELIQLGVMSSPALVMDEKVINVWRSNNEE